jgi:hypothetical protein
MDTPCPWGPGNHDLRGRKLSLAEKRWLANCFISGEFSFVEIYDKFKICRSQLHKFVKKTQLGGVLYCKPGQPRKLDEISLKGIIDLHANNPDVDEKVLRNSIRQGYRQTLARKFPNEAPNLLRRRKALSFMCVSSYSKKIRQRLREELDHPNDIEVHENGCSTM